MREIRAFLAVAEELHFGRAAERLHVSASHVSQTIRAVERGIGCRLFDRTSRRVSLTPAGAGLRAELEPAYERITRAVRAASAAGGPNSRRVLRVGVSTSLPADLPATLLEHFAAEHPACRIVRSDHPAVDLLAPLPGGRLAVDLAITWLPELRRPLSPGDVRVGPVIAERQRALLMAPTHPLANRASVDVEELADHDVRALTGFPDPIAEAWTPPLTPAGRPIRRVETEPATYVEELPDVLADGRLLHLTITSIDTIVALPGLILVPLTGLPPMRCVTIWLSRNDNPWIGRFVELAKQSESYRILTLGINGRARATAGVP